MKRSLLISCRRTFLCDYKTASKRTWNDTVFVCSFSLNLRPPTRFPLFLQIHTFVEIIKHRYGHKASKTLQIRMQLLKNCHKRRSNSLENREIDFYLICKWSKCLVAFDVIFDVLHAFTGSSIFDQVSCPILDNGVGINWRHSVLETVGNWKLESLACFPWSDVRRVAVTGYT